MVVVCFEATFRKVCYYCKTCIVRRWGGDPDIWSVVPGVGTFEAVAEDGSRSIPVDELLMVMSVANAAESVDRDHRPLSG